MTRNEQNETAEIDDYVSRMATEMNSILTQSKNDMDMMVDAAYTKDPHRTAPSPEVLKKAVYAFANMCSLAGYAQAVDAGKECSNAYRLNVSEKIKAWFGASVRDWVSAVGPFKGSFQNGGNNDIGVLDLPELRDDWADQIPNAF